MAKLSVLVPVFNESKTIAQILEKISAVDIEKEVIVVDDASTDGTQNILQDILKKKEYNFIKVIYHSHNKGKGESVREGICEARGEFIVIQDADLEYDPNDYTRLVVPLLEKRADLVLGARFMSGYNGLLVHRLGNRFLTSLLNLLYGSKINDYASCYKMARKDTFLSLHLTSKSFDLEAEIVCKILKNNLRIVEVPVSYRPRSYKEGKKIRWVDGIEAIIAILKYLFVKKGAQ